MMGRQTRKISAVQAANRLSLIAILISALCSCAMMQYYSQSIGGQMELLSKRQPMHELATDPNTSTELRQRLDLVKEIRKFASEQLRLPDNESYRSYADLNRKFVVWNVFAAPEFSLEPLRWCFPIVGCLTYRGYFSEEAASRFARKLRRKGNDVFVAGVAAYSTLGWFDDPVLNTMLHWDNVQLARVIFHELAHQKLYIRHDTAFNEAFATKVAQIGVQRWLMKKGALEALRRVESQQQRETDFIDLVLGTQRRLGSLYASGMDEFRMRTVKAGIFEDMRYDYEALKWKWAGFSGYDEWMRTDLNNAKIASVATYHDQVPAFDALLTAANHDLASFYNLADGIGRLPPEERSDCLAGLMEHGPGFTSSCFRASAPSR